MGRGTGNRTIPIEKLGEVIEILRAGVTERDKIAGRTGVSPTTVTNIKNHKHALLRDPEVRKRFNWHPPVTDRQPCSRQDRLERLMSHPRVREAMLQVMLDTGG